MLGAEDCEVGADCGSLIPVAGAASTGGLYPRASIALFSVSASIAAIILLRRSLLGRRRERHIDRNARLLRGENVRCNSPGCCASGFARSHAAFRSRFACATASAAISHRKKLWKEVRASRLSALASVAEAERRQSAQVHASGFGLQSSERDARWQPGSKRPRGHHGSDFEHPPKVDRAPFVGRS